jgi:hypothetical protein
MSISGSTAYNNARVVTNLVRSLLNDANVQANAGVLIASISRASLVVTVTTIGQHGLVQGDQVFVANVTGGSSNFNGTFFVNVVINPQQYQYLQTSGINESATLLTGTSSGIGLGAVWTDAVLLQYVNSAYRKVQRALSNIGSPGFVNDETLLVVPAVAGIDSALQVSITDATPPPNQLPSNLIVPLKLWERISGSTQDFQEMTDLTNKGGLPSRAQGQILSVWEWRTDGLFFVGALQNTQIRLRYRAAFIPLSDGSSSILIRDSEDAIAYMAAAMAGGSRGSPMATQWDTVGQDHLNDLVTAAVHQNQRAGTRRRPYSSRSGYSPF